MRLAPWLALLMRYAVVCGALLAAASVTILDGAPKQSFVLSVAGVATLVAMLVAFVSFGRAAPDEPAPQPGAFVRTGVGIVAITMVLHGLVGCFDRVSSHDLLGYLAFHAFFVVSMLLAVIRLLSWLDGGRPRDPR